MAGLFDFLQAASNTAASNVSGPVDAFSWLLNKAGVPVQEPILGSEWLKRRGLMKDVPQSAASLGGETFGLLAPLGIAAKAPQIAAQALKAQEAAKPMIANAAEGYMARQGLLQPATVWHGSPHKFDKFDSAHIGKGEGAQAYGHGLYLADQPGVAKTYAEMQLDEDKAFRTATDAAWKFLRERSPFADDAITWGPLQSKTTREQFVDLYKRNPDAVWERLSPQARTAVEQSLSGNLYKVDLPDEQIGKMLDWDAPLSQQAKRLGPLLSDVQDVGKVAAQKVQQLAQQPGLADWAKRDLMADAAQLAQSKSPQHVAGVLKRMQLEYGISPDSGPFKPVAQEFLSFVKGMQAVPNMDTGGGAVSYLQARYGEKAASDLLRQQGIPGIRYLDGGSRGAGQGTSNYVVFPGEEGLLKILERNGVGLLK